MADHPPTETPSHPTSPSSSTRLELDLTGWAYGGEAVGRDGEGRVIFVPFAWPAERVRVDVVEPHARWARGRSVQVIMPSPERVPPRCRHFTLCGGCHYQHVSYPAQLQAKAAIVRSQLERLGGFRDPPVEATVPSPTPWNTRNHLQFSLSPQGRLAFQAAGASDAEPSRLVPIEECHLPEPALGELWPRLDMESVPGLRRVGLRAGADGETMVILHGEGEPDLELSVGLSSSVVWLGPGGAAVLAGSGALEFEVLGRRFRVSAGSFFQVHTALTAELVQRALQAIAMQPGETVYDLYAGVGLFSAFFAAGGARVLAVEESPWSCADFVVNLDEFDDVALYEARVEEVLPELTPRPDAVLVDPPRAGLGRQVCEALIGLAPSRIVYVSCDPATLARDGQRLAAAGYRLERVTPIDLFPQTFHIETISLWQR
ncbi:MAG TPA: class I SAM-dependent RNA methyltransferase [Anaerolineales bacterium]|nr:class I SAM-dependent RNA methyltransferase [Anaerolineales bacterium]